MKVTAQIVKMELNGDYEPPMMDVTFSYRNGDEDSSDFSETTFTWTQELAKEFKVGQDVTIMLGATALIG